jgi:O-antigen/teichoic acid export membrane protein
LDQNFWHALLTLHDEFVSIMNLSVKSPNLNILQFLDEYGLSKAVELAKVSVRGGFHLLWGLAASTVISAIGTILVARLLDPNEFGLYAIALAVPHLIELFRDLGVNVAIIKYSAQYNSESQRAKIRSIIFSGIVFEVILGLILTIISFLISDFLATSIFHRPTVATLIQIASFVTLAGALTTTAEAAFIGLERMEFSSITRIVHSTLKTVLIPTLVILGLGVFGATIGYTLAFLTAGLVGTMLLLKLFKKIPKENESQMQIWTNIKTMFKFGLPVSIASIITSFLPQYYNFLVAIYATDAIVGNYTIATSFVILISFVATPVTTMLFPAFSKLDPQKDPKVLENIFQFSIKYASLLVVPVTTIVICLSQPGVSTLFGDKYVEAPLFLSLLGLSYLYTPFGSLSIEGFLNGQGHTAFNLKLTLIKATLAFSLGFLLISQFGVIGLIIAALVAEIPRLVFALHWIKKNYGLTLDWLSSVKILLSSTIAGGITYIAISCIILSAWLILLIAIVIFLPILIIAMILTKAINRSDIDSLRAIFSEFWLLRHLFSSFLNLIDKTMRLFEL